MARNQIDCGFASFSKFPSAPLTMYFVHSKHLLYGIVVSGLVANGFTEVLEDERSDTRMLRDDAARTIQRYIREFVERRRFRNEVAMAKKDAKRRGTYPNPDSESVIFATDDVKEAFKAPWPLPPGE